MHKTRTFVTLLFLVTSLVSILVATEPSGFSYGNVQVIQAAGEPAVGVKLMATNQTTSWDARDAAQVRFVLPVLYLHQNRQNTGDIDRTLDINLTGLDGGIEIEAEILSRHEDISTGMVYTETHPFTLPDPTLYC